MKVTRTAIVKFLKSKSLYEKVDEVHITALLQGIKFCDEATDEMNRDSGAIKDKSSNPEKEVRQITQAPGLYVMGYGLIIKASRQLGIGPRARFELGIDMDEKDDGFNPK